MFFRNFVSIVEFFEIIVKFVLEIEKGMKMRSFEKIQTIQLWALRKNC